MAQLIKINSAPVQTEAQIVSSMKVLTRAIETLTRLASNKDSEQFKKDCVAFRNGLVGVEITKNGIYTIPKRYNDYIDSLYETKALRSTRQAVKNSIIACYYLGMNGTDSKGCIDKAAKGKAHIETLGTFEWASIKKGVKDEQNKVKAAKKAKDEAAKIETVVSDTTQASTTAPVVCDTTQASTTAPVVCDTTQASTTAPVQTVKVSSDAGISKDAGIRGEALYKSLFNSESEAVLIYLARKILAELQA
jgi:hypothetical protein